MDKKIIVALDGISKADALALAAKLRGLVWGFKVNDLLVECGLPIISELKAYGNVFADAKLHDIPNTVLNGVKRLAGAGADLITIHASGGKKMIAEAAGASGSAKILAVTVLTSLNEQDSREVFGKTPREAVLMLARIAKDGGAHGTVCSPEEVALLASEPELQELIKVVPGIRPSWHGTPDDQARTNTPAEALKAGASLLVIGRPIVKHEDPARAAEMINQEIAACRG